MKKIFVTVTLAILAGCAQQPQNPRPTSSQNIGMANPASVYCEKQGGELTLVKQPTGDVGYCTLPSGERIEEWALFRRDNK